MKKYYIILCLILVTFSIEAQKELETTLNSSTKVTANGEGALYFAGTKDVNFRFSQRISPHGDCVDVINGYAFITWYKGGLDKRNLMLSRKNLNVPNSNWVTIEFPHKHIGQGGELINGTGIRGDSHNTAAIGVSTIDNTIHILYDMHAYRRSSLPNDFFNYSVSLKNKAFVPDDEFTLDIFNPKQNYLKQGENYERITYPMIHRADDGSLVARYRIGGSGNGDIFMAHYDGNVWTDNWLFQEGTIPLPNRNSYYGGERFINGKFYAGFSIRYANNNNSNPTNGFAFNSGLYYAYTNGVPKDQTTQWFNANNQAITLPIKNNLNENLDQVKIGEPGTDFGTANNPRTTSDPSWTVTENGAIHFITRVDNINVHYYKKSSDATFSSNSGGIIPNPQVRGEVYSYKNHVFMVELIAGKVNVKTTLEGENNWKIIYTGTDTVNFAHFNAFVLEDKLYVYLMENTGNNIPGVGDKRPLYFKEFTLSEKDIPVVVSPDLLIEAEDYTTASSNIVVGTNASASGGEYIDAFASNQFLEYKFQIPATDIYNIVLFAAVRNRDDSVMDIEINGQLYSNVLIAKTGDWNIYGENLIPDITLNQGENTIRLVQKRSLSSEPDKIELYLKTSLTVSEFNKNNIAIYPNPSKGIFNVESNFKNLKYTLFSIEGQVVKRGRVSDNQVDFSNYRKGIYILELTEDTNKIVKRIIIK